MNEKKHSTPVIVLSVLLAVSLVLLAVSGAYIAMVLRYIPADDLLELAAVRSIIDRNFVLEYDEEAFSDGMLSGLVESLGDRYSVYRDYEEHGAYIYDVMGEFGGIGVAMSKNEEGRICVLRVYPDTPAEKGAVAEGDCILAVNGEPVAEDIEAVAESIRGEEGSEVTLTFYRPSDDTTFEKTFRREMISEETTVSRMLTDKIGYLCITAFNNKTAEETINALTALEESGAEALVLDLRDNRGGNVSAAVKIADHFLDEGVIYTVIRKNGKETPVLSDAEQDAIPLCVLTNDGTGSASELLSGALKDRGRAKLVGEKTHGKGIMQNQYRLPGGVLTLTFAEYATPDGVRIHQKGIAPDVEVSLNPEDRLRWPILTLEQDFQLQKAIEILQ